MKLSYYTTALILAASLASCSAYQNAQMPDDLYYTKGAEAEEYLVMSNDDYSPEDSYIRSKIRNRQRFSATNNNINYSQMGNMNAYGSSSIGMYNLFGGFNRFGGGLRNFGLYNPFMFGTGLSMGWGMGYGSMFNPMFGFDPYGMGHLGMGYYGGYPFGMYGGGYPGFYGGGYPIGYYNGGKGNAIANKPTRTFNSNNYNRSGQYNNNNSMMNSRNSNSFGSSMRNVFTPATNSRVNPNYRGSASDRPTRSYTNPRSNYTPSRTMPSNNSSMGGSRMGGGSSGGSSSGGGGGISRPTRN